MVRKTIVLISFSGLRENYSNRETACHPMVDGCSLRLCALPQSMLRHLTAVLAFLN
jgi:hypothetical protein